MLRHYSEKNTKGWKYNSNMAIYTWFTISRIISRIPVYISYTTNLRNYIYIIFSIGSSCLGYLNRNEHWAPTLMLVESLRNLFTLSIEKSVRRCAKWMWPYSYLEHKAPVADVPSKPVQQRTGRWSAHDGHKERDHTIEPVVRSQRRCEAVRLEDFR